MTHDFHRRLILLRHLTHTVILWERAVLGCWRSLCWVGLFAGLWLWQVPEIFGAGGMIGALILFLGGLVYFLWRDAHAVRWPLAHHIDRRLEAASGLSHRPLAHLDDRLANPDLERTQDLWAAGREQAHGMVRRLRAPAPQAQLAQHDPVALRIFVLLFVVVGAINAGSLWAEHLRSGLWPFAAAVPEAGNSNVTLWITPPDYTHLPPAIIQNDVRKPLIVPAGSAIKARVRDGWGRPVLRMGSARLRFMRVGTGAARSWNIAAKILPGNVIRIRQSFLTRLHVPIRYRIDQPPRLNLKNPPAGLPNGGLEADVVVHDDYGVTALGLRMDADPAVPSLPLGAPLENWRSVTSPAGRDAELKPVFDLTWHPWAGLPVLLTLKARDALGQVTSLPPIRVTLPERPFYNPVARQIIALRKRLAWAPRAAAPNVAYELEILMSRPDAFRGDKAIFLGLRSAASRLVWDASEAGAASVVTQLWDIALRAEDGNLSLSARGLQQAQEDLQKLLNESQATPAQLSAAAERLRDALTNYLSQLYQGLQRRMAESGLDPSQLTPELFARKMNADGLSAMIDKLRAQALAGNRDAARQLLSQLQEMTQAMNPVNARMPPQLQAMFKNLAGMSELIQKQTDLHARTVKAQTKVAAADQAKILENLQSEQETLRHTLAEIMAQAGKVPAALSTAETAMQTAMRALVAQKPAEAAAAQQQALDQLNQGNNAMKQQLQALLRQMTLMTLGMGKTDPLGRPMGDGQDGSAPPNDDVKIPDQAERRQIQEILRILRQRTGELSRPDYERDYYERLLQEF